MTESPVVADARGLLEFLSRLGQAYLACGEQTAQVELLLRRIATAHKARRPRVVAFPTAIFLSMNDGVEDRQTIYDGPTQSLRLDQVADVYDLGSDAQQADFSPREGIERLATILRSPPRFGAVGMIVGHSILSVGVAMILTSSFTNILVALILGMLVGGLKLLNKDRPVLAVPLPVIAATLVSSLVYLAVKQDLPVIPIHSLVPPLVSFLPGAMLSLGMVELVYGDMVSGTSRLTTGFVQLALLAFGIVSGAALVGVSSEQLVEAVDVVAIPWVQWLGVLIFGLGVYVHFSAPRQSLGWMLLVMVLAFAAQPLGLLDSIEVQGSAGHGDLSPLLLAARAGLAGPLKRDPHAQRSRHGGRWAGFDHLYLHFARPRFAHGRLALQMAQRTIWRLETANWPADPHSPQASPPLVSLARPHSGGFARFSLSSR
jgi:uncharacterized membrane protein YjjP (DUF1212 family)